VNFFFLLHKPVGTSSDFLSDWGSVQGNQSLELTQFPLCSYISGTKFLTHEVFDECLSDSPLDWTRRFRNMDLSLSLSLN
jgi:hypothetical protein